jgi:hypothetical protein
MMPKKAEGHAVTLWIYCRPWTTTARRSSPSVADAGGWSRPPMALATPLTAPSRPSGGRGRRTVEGSGTWWNSCHVDDELVGLRRVIQPSVGVSVATSADHSR